MDIYEGKSFVLNRFLDKFFELLEFYWVSVFGKPTPCFDSKSDWIERLCCVSVWSRLGLGSDRSGGRCLTCGESIVLIIHNNIGDIKISSACVHEVSHTNTKTITITSCSHYGNIWIRHLYSCSKWKCSSMECLCCVSIDVLTGFPTTSYTWYYHPIMTLYFKLLKSILNSHDDQCITTAWTPLYVC